MIQTQNVFAEESVSGYAWSENTGWIDFSKATVNDSKLSGYAYSPNIGWISLDCANTSSCETVDYKISNSSGTLSGYAWSENTGWIDFSRVTIATTTGVFSGHAYSPNIGWISMNCSNTSSCEAVDYGVSTTWRIQTPSPPSPPSQESNAGQSRSSGGRRFSQTTSVSTSTTPTILPPCNPSDNLRNKPNINCKPSYEPQYNFLVNLRFGMQNNDVRALQQFLNNNGFVVSDSGAGSPGNETTYFGEKTRTAVIEFQRANGITPIGIVGPITRDLINKMK